MPAREIKPPRLNYLENSITAAYRPSSSRPKALL
jgi:hypothetical protein